MEHKSNGSDILGSYRPPPVTAGCTKEIPETIHEESESRRQSIDATKRKTSVQRRFETLADIVQSSEDSANSNTLSSLNDDGNSSNTQNMNVSYSDIEMSEMNLLGADSGVYEQDKRGFKNAASSSFTSMSDGLTNGGDNMSLPSTDSMTSVNNVGNSSKVQPLKGDSFESAVGFLLESSLKKNPQGGKRVKFNYVWWLMTQNKGFIHLLLDISLWFIYMVTFVKLFSNCVFVFLVAIDILLKLYKKTLAGLKSALNLHVLE